MSKVLPLTECSELMGRKMVYHPRYAIILGLKEAIFIEQIIYWTPKTSVTADRWVFKSCDHIKIETGLTYDEQRRVREVLVERGFMEENYDRKKHRLYFRVLGESLDAHLSEQLEIVQMAEGESLDASWEIPSSYKDSLLTAPQTTDQTASPQQTALEPEVQNQSAVRTRTCSKCRADIPEDDLRDHERTCEGGKKKRNKGERKPLAIVRGVAGMLPTQTESIQSETMPPRARAEFAESAAPGRGEIYGICFGLLRRAFRSKFGKTLGSYPQGNYGEKTTAMIDKHGSEKVQAGFDLWMDNVKRDFVRGSSFPFAIFLKNAEDWIEDAESEPYSGSPIETGDEDEELLRHVPGPHQKGRK